MTTYQPKGGMCTSCKKKYLDCSHLNFSEMPKIDQFENVIVVRCTEYERGSKADG